MRHGVWLLWLFLAPPAAAQAKWTLTLERGWTTYSSAVHDTASEPAHLRPWRPAVYSLRLARESGRWELALGGGIALGQWGVNIGDFVVLPDESLHLYEIAPELGMRIGATATGVVARLHLGPVLAIWVPSGEDPRQRLGAQAGGSLAFPLGAKWSASARADLALSRSLVNKDEETDDLTRASTMRRGRLALGITRRL